MFPFSKIARKLPKMFTFSFFPRVSKNVPQVGKNIRVFKFYSGDSKYVRVSKFRSGMWKNDPVSRNLHDFQKKVPVFSKML